MPTKRRNMTSHEESEHSGIAVDAVVRDLAIAEEAREREIAEGVADERRLARGLVEEVGATRDAAEIEAGARPTASARLELAQHAREVGGSIGGIAAAEKHAIADSDR